jgi:hypothetical protein
MSNELHSLIKQSQTTVASPNKDTFVESTFETTKKERIKFSKLFLAIGVFTAGIVLLSLFPTFYFFVGHLLFSGLS